MAISDFTKENYGLRFTDRPDEEDTDDEYDEKSCPVNCCDSDCECDDCTRCSQKSFEDSNNLEDLVAAA